MKLFLINAILVILLFSTRLENVAAAAFSPVMPIKSTRKLPALFRSDTAAPRLVVLSPCFANVGRDNDDSRSSMDDMRRLLEASWNIEAMGSVPTNVESAADAAVASVMNAQQTTGDDINIFNVNILLAQFDITQGKNLYDEVLSVDFCIALANRFFNHKKNGNNKKSCIIVRDDETIRIVQRVLNAREKEKQQQQQPTVAALDNLDDDDDDEEEEDDDDDDADDDELSIGGKRSSISTGGKSDVDSFRRQLMAGWDSEAGGEATKPSSKEDSTRPRRKSRRTTKPLQQKEALPRIPSSSYSGPTTTDRHYRLSSMFGDAIIPQGTDMMRAAVEAVAANALPEPDEEIIIILSAVSREEMIGVRSLVAKYQQEQQPGTTAKKLFILVNCKLGPPVPVELRRAQTVYSILPLIAKPAQRPENIFVAGQDNRSKVSATASEPQPMKIVILRRFPRDWEVFVDCNKGRGFELAATAPASQVPQQGPSMEWVSSSVKRFLQTKS